MYTPQLGKFLNTASVMANKGKFVRKTSALPKLGLDIVPKVAAIFLAFSVLFPGKRWMTFARYLENMGNHVNLLSRLYLKASIVSKICAYPG